MDEIEQDLRGLRPGFIVSQVVGVSMVVLMSIWTGHFMGGFTGQSNPGLEFNWHPLLLTISLVYLYGNGILIYRLGRNERKSRLKVAHATVMGAATVLACFGLKAAFDSHSLAVDKAGNNSPIPHTYSLHSWCGMFTISLAVAQWFLGLVTFLWPGLASHLRTTFLPIHIFTGLAIFVLACATALMGITEKAFFRMADHYKDKSSEATLVNLLGLSIVLFCIIVLGLVSKQSFKRLHRPEDQMLLTETQTE